MKSTLPPNLRALIVGGTNGIGRAIALQLANSLPSSTIIIAGRSIAKAKAELEEAGAVKGGNVEYVKVDCGSMEDTKRMCEEVAIKLRRAGGEGNEKGVKLDMLVLTPGILSMAGYSPTGDGIDMKMSLHYYSRMLIIRELSASSSLSSSAIVLSVLDGWTSDAHSSRINWEDMDLSGPGAFSVSNCKHHAVGFTDVQFSSFASDPSESNANRTYIHAYPGIVDTPLFKGLPAAMRWGMIPMQYVIGVKPEACAEYMLKGVEAARKAQADAGGNEGKKWWNIDNKGKLVKKKEIDEEMGRKVQEHTWAMVDGQGRTRPPV